VCLDWSEGGWGRVAAFKRAIGRSTIEILKLERILDPFCAYGISSVIYAQAESVKFLWANDKDEIAFEYATQNLANLVREKDFVITNWDAKHLLRRMAETGAKFDWVDIDPFSKAWRYTPWAVRCCDRVLSITENAHFYRDGLRASLDLFNSVTMRRYGYKMPRLGDPFLRDEVFIRGLMGYVEREARKHNRSVTPLLSLANQGVGKIYVEVTDVQSDNLEDAWICLGCVGQTDILGGHERGLHFRTPCQQHETNVYAGQIWSRDIVSKDVVKRISHLLEDELFQAGLANLPHLRRNKILYR
jgi:tRNA G26 N,N-dimethylase Trm1